MLFNINLLIEHLLCFVYYVGLKVHYRDLMQHPSYTK